MILVYLLSTSIQVSLTTERKAQWAGKTSLRSTKGYRHSLAQGSRRAPKVHLRRPLSPALAEALTTAWPDFLDMLAWWRSRQHQRPSPEERLARVTYHVSPTWIQAIRREANITGDSDAAVVNRALRQYFAGTVSLGSPR